MDLAGGFTCKYDSWNRLAEVKQGETVVAIYEYDGLNRRVKKHIDTDSPADPNGVDVYQHFFYNNRWQILETRESDSVDTAPDTLQPEYQFVWSQRYIDAPVLRDKNTDDDDLCDDETLYYLTDAQMNVTALVDTDGDAVERYVYDPYGNVMIYDGDWSNTRSISSYANPILFAGYYRDGETHLYHVRHRMYHPSLGRWLQRDPIGYADGMNLYEYVRSGPVQRVDPFGRWGKDMHLDATLERAKNHLSDECTEIIAKADQNVDEKTGSVWFPQYHFQKKKDWWGNVTDYTPGRDDYQVSWWRDGTDSLMSVDWDSVKDGLTLIGKSLHCLQDSSTHQAGGGPATGGPPSGIGKGHMAETPFDHAPSWICLVWGDALGIFLPMCVEARNTNPNWDNHERPDIKNWFEADWDKAADDTEAKIRDLLDLPGIKCWCKK